MVKKPIPKIPKGKISRRFVEEHIGEGLLELEGSTNSRGRFAFFEGSCHHWAIEWKTTRGFLGRIAIFLDACGYRAAGFVDGGPIRTTPPQPWAGGSEPASPLLLAVMQELNGVTSAPRLEVATRSVDYYKLAA